MIPGLFWANRTSPKARIDCAISKRHGPMDYNNVFGSHSRIMWSHLILRPNLNVLFGLPPVADACYTCGATWPTGFDETSRILLYLIWLGPTVSISWSHRVWLLDPPLFATQNQSTHHRGLPSTGIKVSSFDSFGNCRTTPSTERAPGANPCRTYWFRTRLLLKPNKTSCKCMQNKRRGSIE
jgi:hypothetical protein